MQLLSKGHHWPSTLVYPYNDPLPRITFMKNTFSYFGTFLWNSLPLALWQASSLGPQTL